MQWLEKLASTSTKSRLNFFTTKLKNLDEKLNTTESFSPTPTSSGGSLLFCPSIKAV